MASPATENTYPIQMSPASPGPPPIPAVMRECAIRTVEPGPSYTVVVLYNGTDAQQNSVAATWDGTQFVAT